MRRLSLDTIAELMAARVNSNRRFVAGNDTRGKVFMLLTSGERSNVQDVRASTMRELSLDTIAELMGARVNPDRGFFMTAGESVRASNFW